MTVWNLLIHSFFNSHIVTYPYIKFLILKIKDTKKQRVYMKFCFILEKTLTDTHVIKGSINPDMKFLLTSCDMTWA